MLPMRTIDVGVPLLAMHSARELMGSADQEQLNRLMNHFLGGKQYKNRIYSMCIIERHMIFCNEQ